MKRLYIIAPILTLVLFGAVALVHTEAAKAAETPWINDLGYGSAGAGFYWDTASGQVWTSERGWHVFSPQPARSAAALWVNHLTYGSAGGGFYWDATSNQVWTAERGWHTFNPQPRGTPPPPPPPPTSGPPTTGARTFGAGTFIVGSDVQAGTYRLRTAASSCYWERLSGFGGSLSEVLANDFTGGVAVVTISPTDKGFSTHGCGIWTFDLSAITSSPTAPFGEGMFIVGTDVASATWRSAGGGSCYWERLSGFSGALGNIIANDFGGTNPVVTIAATDKGFSSHGCGTWTKVS